jgi:hypothetical protein
MSNEHNLLGKVWFSGPFGLSPVTFGRENPKQRCSAPNIYVRCGHSGSRQVRDILIP